MIDVNNITQNNCYLCSQSLTPEIKSNEHILPNAIGGRLTSEKLLCKNCNSRFGCKADAELVKQLNFLSRYLQIPIKKETLHNQIIAKTKNGQKYRIINGNQPTLPQTKIEKKIEENRKHTYSIEARNEKELNNILENIRKKYSKFNSEFEIGKNEQEQKYLEEPLITDFQIGGDLAFQSIVKTAVNYYIHTQNNIKQIKHLIPYLKDEIKLEIVRHFYSPELIYEQEMNEIVHLIHLFNIKKNKKLYCLIEFFSVFSFLIILSDNYEGEDISSTYCYDILQNKELIKKVVVKIPENEQTYFSEKDFEIIIKKFNRAIEIGNINQFNNEIDKIIKKNFDKNKQKSTIIKEEIINQISHEIADAYIRYFT